MLVFDLFFLSFLLKQCFCIAETECLIFCDKLYQCFQVFFLTKNGEEVTFLGDKMIDLFKKVELLRQKVRMN
ncbi:hypothetical protein EGI31_22200 [Lacihabitans soyangensis]|uniref:Uncharacterized protein n=1 Tax=Lacihabitans soyangensis TaxID=869394 RepID=A0AAE3H753_9BACT|nr:hypothetical protein [Lacihabitans soyangensis]